MHKMCIIILVLRYCEITWRDFPWLTRFCPASSPSPLFSLAWPQPSLSSWLTHTQWLHEDRGGNAWLQRATESLHRPEQSSKTAQDLGQPASWMEGWEDPNKGESQKYEEVRDDIETRLQRNSGRWRQKGSGNVVKYIRLWYNLSWPEDSRIWWFICSLSNCSQNTTTKHHKVLFEM